MTPMFPFVQLEFAHAIGPGAGRYTVKLADGANGADGEHDVLQVHIVAGAVARQGLRRRTRPARSGELPPDVPVVRVSWIAATQPLHDRGAAKAELERLRADEDSREELVEAVLRVLNLAVRAHRASAQDPYLPELTRDDPRAVRFGIGTATQLTAGEWEDAFLAPPPRVDKIERALRLAPSEAVALVLRSSLGLLESEELLLRARLDADQGRWRGAALQLDATIELLRVEAEAIRAAGEALPFEEEDLGLRQTRVQALRDLAMQDDLDEVAQLELVTHVDALAATYAAWRSPVVEHA